MEVEGKPLLCGLKKHIKYDIVQTGTLLMSNEQSRHKRQWRDYQTESGARPIKEFLLALPDEDRAAILEEMEYVREHGKSVARHFHKEKMNGTRFS
jgi:hypothetical protein